MLMSKILSQAQFVKRFAQNAGVLQKDAKLYLHTIQDEIIKSLSKGYAVSITGFGTLKKAKFPSKMMPNPNNRSQKILVLERNYMRIKPSQRFKQKIKSKLFPEKYQLLEPKPHIAKDKQSREIKINRSFTIPIRVRPHIPPIGWREPLSAQILDLRRQNLDSGDRLLKNIFRRIDTPNTRGISISPTDITYYDDTNYTDTISEILYRQIIKTLKKHLPQTFSTPQSWRLLATLPPRRLYNYAMLPDANDNWLVSINRPRAGIDNPIITNNLPAQTQKIVDGLIAKKEGRLLVTGSPQSRRATLEQVEQYLTSLGLPYHTALEYHHHPTHPHINFTGHLREFLPQANIHNLLIMDDISSADNFYQLRNFSGVVIATVNAPNANYLNRILKLQQVPEGFVDAVVDTRLIPSPCSKCMPQYAPAVRFPHMRRIAGSRNSLLHVHPVKIRVCNHKETPILVHTYHNDNNESNKSDIGNQLYDMALRHEIDYDTVDEVLRTK